MSEPLTSRDIQELVSLDVWGTTHAPLYVGVDGVEP